MEEVPIFLSLSCLVPCQNYRSEEKFYSRERTLSAIQRSVQCSLQPLLFACIIWSSQVSISRCL